MIARQVVRCLLSRIFMSESSFATSEKPLHDELEKPQQCLYKFRQSRIPNSALTQEKPIISNNNTNNSYPDF